MIRSFTGPTSLSTHEKVQIAQHIYSIMNTVETVDDELWRSGCARGLDSIIAYTARAYGIPYELYVPFGKHNETMVRELAPYAAQVIRVPAVMKGKGKDRRVAEPALQYRKRNTTMVRGSEQLEAFLFGRGWYRSGEWMTVTIAETLEVTVAKRILFRG